MNKQTKKKKKSSGAKLERFWSNQGAHLAVEQLDYVMRCFASISA